MNINTRSIVLVAIALVVAGATALLARNLVSAPEVEQTIIVQKENADTQILVSNKDVTTGYFLKNDDLTWQSWPDENVNENYILKTSDAKADQQISDLVGSVVKSPITAGEPIVSGRVVKPGARGFMAAVLAPGYRAVSITINSRTGLSGFIFPGDSVDILLTHAVSEAEEGEEDGDEIQASETVLKDIRVLAIDTQMSNDTNTPSIGKIATFEVTPKQAEKIALMSRMGELSLALRSLAIDDDKIVQTSDNTRKNVTYASEVSRVVAEQDGTGVATGLKQTVKIVRAGQTENLTFKNPNELNR